SSSCAPPPTALYTLSLHDALPIWPRLLRRDRRLLRRHWGDGLRPRTLVVSLAGGGCRHVAGPLLGRAHLPPSWSLLHAFDHRDRDRKSTRLNSSHVKISYAVFCLK